MSVTSEAISLGGVILVAAFARRSLAAIDLFASPAHRAEANCRAADLSRQPNGRVNSTKIYCEYAAEHVISMDDLAGPGCPFYGPNVHLAALSRSRSEFNAIRGPAIIIASSG